MKLRAGIYLHVPFCERKCPYCDFNSYAGLADLHDAYVEALCRDMARLVARAQESGVHYVARTLFIGGGTPTLLKARHFERILLSAQDHLGWHSGLETTVEANPGTVALQLIRDLRGLGVNRVSLGVQSLDDDMLRRLGRIHNSRQAWEATEICREGGIENLSLDLMYGLPEQTLAQWKATLERAIAIRPEHLSLYPLAVEPHTPFWRLQETGRLPVPEDDEIAGMYELAEQILGSCYEHYEISNWSRHSIAGSSRATAYRCQHNLIYWHDEPYIGLGAGAHSYLHSERYVNVSAPADYIERINSGLDPVETRESINLPIEIAETLILGLRLSDGVRRRLFRARFGRELDDVLGNVLSEGRARGLIHDDGESIALSQRGKFLSNEVFVPILEHLKNTTSC